jgi:methane monooxygenase PmoA-like
LDTRIPTPAVFLTLVTLAASVGPLALAHGQQTQSVFSEVDAGSSDRESLIVEAELPLSLQGARHYCVERLDDGKMLPAQIVPSSTSRIAWLLRDPLAKGTTRRYQLHAGSANTSTEGVTVKDEEGRLLVDISGKSVLAYNHATVPSPDPDHPYYARSGYLHPVYAPDGQILTDDFNPDHAHQHGVMFAWRKGTFKGRETDGWHQAAKLGRVEHVKLEHYGSGPVFGHFTTRLRQLDLTAPDGPKPILNERWHVRIANLPECFVFDMEMTQTCAGESPYTVEKIHYGGMAVRGSRDWGGKTPIAYEFLTDLGKTREDGDQSPARWVDFTGVSNGNLAGMAVLCHPQNYRFPQPVRLHPSMPYFCFTPASLGRFEIVPDRPYVSRYRFICHKDRLTPAQLERLWQDYAQPPKVRVIVESPGNQP